MHIVAVCVVAFAAVLAGESKGAVSFSDYFPTDPAQHGIKTFEWTFGLTGQFMSQIGSTEMVPYVSGPISGRQIATWPGLGTLLAQNNGTDVKFLGTDEGYISTDELLTDHPSVWSFGTVDDGMIVDQQGSYLVAKDLSGVLDNWNDQMLLFTIQDVTVMDRDYEDAVIFWWLDTKYPFVDPQFQEKDADLGITVPESSDTEGHSLTDFDIYAYGIGLIAGGGIDAESNTLTDLYELKELRSPIPAPGAVLLGTIGAGLVGWLRRRRSL